MSRMQSSILASTESHEATVNASQLPVNRWHEIGDLTYADATWIVSSTTHTASDAPEKPCPDQTKSNQERWTNHRYQCQKIVPHGDLKLGRWARLFRGILSELGSESACESIGIHK